MADGAKDKIKETLGNIAPDIECYKETPDIAPHNANGIILVCETSSGCIIGGSALGKRGVEPHSVGWMAAEQITNSLASGSCVDSYIQDQLIIFMALAEGTSSIRVGEITMHTKTAIHIVELLTKVKFIITEDQGSNIISCTGMGLRNPYVL